MIGMLKDLELTLHPYKIYIGKVEKEFDFLGYRITLTGLRLACETIKRFQHKLTGLYEQGASKARIRQYVTNWTRWTCAGGLVLSAGIDR